MNIKQLVKEIFLQIKSDWYLPVVEKQVYSEQEQVIGVWTDGKPLYRRVINVGALPNNQIKNYDHGISNIDFIYYVNGVAIRPSDKLSIPIPCGAILGTTNYQLRGEADATKITIHATSDYSACFAYITLEYTKTTDSPAQQSKVPFEPLTEYSTDEKMIGYWIDGKPLYRKVVEFGALPNNTGKNVPHGIDSGFTLVSIKGASKNSSGVNLPIPASSTDPSYSVHCYIDGGDIVVETRVDRSGFQAYITLEYTKTTD